VSSFWGLACVVCVVWMFSGSVEAVVLVKIALTRTRKNAQK
jgi:hypothetical protein